MYCTKMLDYIKNVWIAQYPISNHSIFFKYVAMPFFAKMRYRRLAAFCCEDFVRCYKLKMNVFIQIILRKTVVSMRFYLYLCESLGNYSVATGK